MTRFTVNDRPVQYRMDPDTPLLWALRDASNLTGTKYGCGTGDCGACTVDIDGEAVRSCQVTIAHAEGRFVTTIEALSPDRGHPLQQAFIGHHALQCGFCTPGMVMMGLDIASRHKNPSEAVIRHELEGNLCRCTGYHNIVKAIAAGAKAMAVILGQADIYLHSGGQYEWDSMAPAAVAIAHGLHASRIDGSPLLYNQRDVYLPDLLICRKEHADRVLSLVASLPKA